MISTCIYTPSGMALNKTQQLTKSKPTITRFEHQHPAHHRPTPSPSGPTAGAIHIIPCSHKWMRGPGCPRRATTILISTGSRLGWLSIHGCGRGPIDFSNTHRVCVCLPSCCGAHTDDACRCCCLTSLCHLQYPKRCVCTCIYVNTRTRASANAHAQTHTQYQ